ncbi:PadR family transcriptional regulator [Micromonospora eburnea]|uniref:PadR family transcriptional regulator, regulatory protein PadR n=1 Tax=Micromonospora eburnea TaxID=227316 RepID=A0A1C6U0Z1_9ACTN|nr:PadR family transcriptional regulator [Micromonospora eburnea]SCL47735.1 PadR family transcriptional regulator, regulatory protein PadR [Micromonospora eburnea]
MIAAEGSGGGDRQAQLLRGVLDMCLLALLDHEPAHGYELVRRLDAAGLAGVGYGTVYPLLTRLRRLGLVTDAVQESPSGPPRKVYALSTEGSRRLAAWKQQWRTFADTVDAAITDAPTTGR